MKRMRTRIAGILVLAVFLAAGALFFFSFRQAQESMSSQMEKDYSVVAEKYAQELTAWVNANAAVIDSMAAEITVSGIYREGYDAFHRYLSETCRILNRDNVIYDIYFTYPDNTMACASDFTADGSVDYIHDRDWFTKAAATGELFFSAPYRDSDSGKPVVTISRGVYSDNVLQGVLAADIFVDVLVDTIRGAEVAPDSYAFLVDQNLGMIVHPNEAYAFDDIPHGVLDIQDAPYEKVVSKVRSGSHETVYLSDYDGVTRGVVVAKMANTGWYVGIATSKAELTRDYNSLSRGFLVTGFLFIAAGCGAAAWLALVLLRRKRRDAESPSGGGEAVPPAPGEASPESGKAAEIPVRSKVSRFLPIALTFLLMVGMVLYTTRTIRDVSVANIREVGEDRIASAAAELENYLGTAKSTLWVTADTVDHMIRSGASVQDLLEYITLETQNQKAHFDVNITGLYGYVLGEYIDGLAWTPPENYDPTRRDWYRNAIAAGGEAVIVSPYVDAQTDDMVISISRMLSGGTDVVSVDFMMNHIQEIISTLQIKEKGYGFIVDRSGRLIAHRDTEKQGRYLTEQEENLALFDRILDVENGTFEIMADSRQCTAFVRRITDQWYAVIVIDNAELLTEVRQQLTFNVLICTVIFALITFFFLLGHSTEKKFSSRIEQMRAEEQKRAYEARALKTEKEAADRASQAKSDFLASMSHEIRTPINAVLGMNEMILRETYLLQDETDPEAWRAAVGRVRSYAGNIGSAGSNLLSIINGVLDFSKIESGKMEITRAEYSLRAVLADVCALVSFPAAGKGLDFQADVEESLPDRLVGDAVRLRQVLTNLLSNAVKYTEQGSVRLSVCGEGGRQGAGDRITLLISVRDTGIGIPEKDMDSLFNKFQRVNLEKTSTVEGTGLGLAITKELLSMMDGEIRVESTYGKGSVFTVRLPQAVASGDPIGAFRINYEPQPGEPDSYRESFRAPDARILIVDDTRMNLTVAVGLLARTEIRIDTAPGGEDAVRKASSVPYDLILMDQRMPEMDGLEALRRIRSQEGPNRDTPVVCMTADAVQGAKERYLSEGFTDYLSKPVDSRSLEDMLLKYLPAGKLLPPAPPASPAAPVKQEAPEGEFLHRLREAGIRPEEGLHYCQGDMALYRTLLAEYLSSAGEKQRQMEEYYRSGDWENYTLLVHSLKSTSRTVGAGSLADDAAALEAAGRAGDLDTLRRLHGSALLKYRRLAEALEPLKMLEIGPEAGRQAPSPDGVLEFPPE